MKAISMAKAKEKMYEYMAGRQEVRVMREGLALMLQVKIQGQWVNTYRILENP